MGIPHPNSPNGCWQRHGYRSEVPADKPHGGLRNIYSPDGTQVLANAGYEEQINYCREHALLLSESELLALT